MSNLEKLKIEILEDGIIDKEEVIKLEKLLYEDGVIDREEADFLFELNDATTGNANDPSWATFFVKAISDHVLKDEESPGEIDADEAKWLIGKIEGDGQVDEIESNLLSAIKKDAKEIDASLKAFMDKHSI